ncbi:MAG TPA: hypothetical protein VMU04_18075 [Candidatus Acidoferrum sp.]|nr:hypothetical protein [Candidatus Acidoferrum sp.]
MASRLGLRTAARHSAKWVLALAAPYGLWAGAALAQTPVALNIDSQSPGYAIPTNFCGLSFETMTLLADSGGGHFFSATNTPLITLFQNVGLKHLRIGGDTVDMPTVAIPTNADIDALFAFAQAAGVKVTYSLRLLNGSTNADAALAKYIWANYCPLLDAFAIGNEPDWNSYHQSDPAITNCTSYLAQWRRFTAAITNAIPAALFCGPDTGGNLVTGSPDSGPGPTWTTSFTQAEAPSGTIAFITQHDYVGENAGSQTAQQGIDAMLSPTWDTGSNQILYAAMAAPVMQTGLGYRFTEANDYSGGTTNASNAFSAALWALDYLCWWASHGALGVDFHNKRWIPTDTICPGASGQLIVNPKGYAIRAFGLGAAGYVAPVTITNTNALNLTGYATGSGADLSVTVVNREHGTGARDAAVTLIPQGFAAGGASAMFLSAPAGNVGATNGVTLGGGTITNNAPWLGEWSALSVGTNGQVNLTVGAVSAAVVRFHAGTPSIRLQRAGNTSVITYTGALLSCTNLLGPFAPVTGASSPYPVPQTDAQRFYRSQSYLLSASARNPVLPRPGDGPH